jgi:cytochrome c oxidase assembly protein subunit 15
MYNKALHWYAVFTAFCTFLLIIAGGLVTSTGSGLAVPDWPLSYGQLMPPMVGGIFYEHGHRMVATSVGLLTVILVIWIWRKDSRRWMRWLALVALGAVIVQGALGGLTVLFMLPTAISASHATLAQTFFSIVSAIALFTSKWWFQFEYEKPKVIIPKTNVTLCVIVASAVYLQLILGAIMRHTGSGLAVPDFPLAYGQLIPSISPEAMESYNRILIHEDVRLAADGAITANQVIIHMLHRLWAVAVASLVVILALRFRSVSNPAHYLVARLMVLLVVVQVGLGAWTVLSRRAVEIATAHVAVGALLLVLSVLLTLMTLRVIGRFDPVLQEGQIPKEAYV